MYNQAIATGNPKTFLIIFGLFVFVLPIGNLLWFPLLALCLLGMWHIAKRFKERSAFSSDEKWFVFLVLAFFVPALISLANTADMGRSFNYLLTLPLFSLAGFYSFVSLRRAASLGQIARIILGLVLIAFAAQIWEFVDPESPFGHGTGGRYHGLFASAFGGNLKLPFIAVALCMFCIGVFIEERAKSLVVLSSVVMIVVVVLSGTRMVWLSLVYLIGFLITALIAFRGRESLRHLLLGLVFLVCATGATIFAAKDTALMERVNQSLVMFEEFNYQNVNSALSNRLPMWETTLKMGAENPWIGTGANAWRYAYPDYVAQDSEGDLVEPDEEQRLRALYLFPHQQVLEVFASTGVLGLLGLMFFYLTLLKLAINAYRTRNAAAFFTVLGLCSYFFPFNTHHAIYSSWITGWLWLWVGIVFGLLNRTPPQASGFAKR